MKTVQQKFEEIKQQAAEFKKSLDAFCDLLTDIRDDDDHPELFDQFDGAVEDLQNGIDVMNDVVDWIANAKANIKKDTVVYLKED